jgi:hypothetical protein
MPAKKKTIKRRAWTPEDVKEGENASGEDRPPVQENRRRDPAEGASSGRLAQFTRPLIKQLDRVPAGADWGRRLPETKYQDSLLIRL